MIEEFDMEKLLLGSRQTLQTLKDTLIEYTSIKEVVTSGILSLDDESEFVQDFHINISLGDYVEFEIFVLPTRKKDVFFVTEIGGSW